MVKRNFNGTQINQSATIVEKAGADVTDCRNLIFVYDNDGNVVPATNGSKPIVGVALIEEGYNDITGAESGKLDEGDDVSLQIKDIGYVLAGATIAKGAEITSDANGCAVTAQTGNYVAGIALSAATKDGLCRVQISKYQKN